MRILDKIKIKNKEYICIQIILLKGKKIFRIHESFGEEEAFIVKKDDNYTVITEEKVLKEIYKFLEVKNTDIIINKKRSS